MFNLYGHQTTLGWLSYPRSGGQTRGGDRSKHGKVAKVLFIDKIMITERNFSTKHKDHLL